MRPNEAAHNAREGVVTFCQTELANQAVSKTAYYVKEGVITFCQMELAIQAVSKTAYYAKESVVTSCQKLLANFTYIDRSPHHCRQRPGCP